MATGSQAPLTHPLADSAATEPTQPRDIELGEMLGALANRRWRLLGASLAGAVLALALVFFLVPVRYTASSTLFILPSSFSSHLRPKTLSIQGYLRLLESDAVVAEAQDRLRARAVLGENEILEREQGLFRRGQAISSEIIVSRRDEEKSLASLLILRGSSESAEGAAAIVNAWAEVFVEETSQLVARAVDPVIGLVREQESLAVDDLDLLESKLLEETTDFQARMSELERSWKQKLLAFDRKTEDLRAKYQIETRNGFVAKLDDFRQNAGMAVESTSSLGKLVALRLLMAQTLEVSLLSRSLNDEALWDNLLQPTGDNSKLLNTRLVSEEINPVYQQLATGIAELEQEVSSLEAATAPQLRPKIAAFASAVESLQRTRNAGLDKLIKSRLAERLLMVYAYRSEQDVVRTEWRLRSEQLSSRLFTQRAFANRLAKEGLEAQIATAEQRIQDIILGSSARPPGRADSRPFRGAAATGLFLGLMAALLWLVLPLLAKAAAR